MVLHQEIGKVRSGSELSDDEVFRSTSGARPETSLAGSGHGHKVILRSLVVRPGSVSSTPCLVPQPVSFNLSKIPDIETSGKDMDSEAEVRPKTLHQKVKRMRNDASIASHSLQLMSEEFRKSANPKSRILRSGYSVNAMLIFKFMA